MTGKTHAEKEGYEFAIHLMKKMNQILDSWKQETGLSFVLCGTPSKQLPYQFLAIDKERYGTIKGITDKECYTNSYYVQENLPLYDRLQLESKLQDLSLGGGIIHIPLSSDIELEEIIKYISKNVQYVKFDC